MFKNESAIGKEFDSIGYYIQLSQELYDGYNTQRWENNIMIITIGGISTEETFTLYTTRGVKQSKVIRALRKMKEAEWVYFADRVFGEKRNDPKYKFSLYYDGKTGFWSRYHKEHTRYESGRNNSDVTRKIITGYWNEKQPLAIETKEQREKRMQKLEEENELVKIARLNNF